jgi:hypothetical protein
MEAGKLNTTLATIEPDELGKNLVGFGVNIICPNPFGLCTINRPCFFS